MKFEFVKKVSKPVPSYSGKNIETGDTVELEGFLAKKALGNPDYRLIEEETQGDSAKPEEAPKPKQSKATK